MTLHDRLLRSIRNAGADILRREDLVRLGDEQQVARALARLIHEGELRHLGYGLYLRRPKNEDPALRLRDFEQLARVAWNRRAVRTVGARDALALYERNWRFIEPATMRRQEKDLLDFLVREYGGGVLHV